MFFSVTPTASGGKELHKIEIRRRELGLSIAEVAKRSGIAETTIRGIEAETPNGYKTRFDVAKAIAAGLESQTHTLFDAIELSHLGRPAKTGRPIADIDEKRTEKPCPSCNYILPSNGKCNNGCKEVIAS
ncbi:MAG: helix-turn-helix transcriptional regulator [Candidatus Microsaccharimonas sp.]